jgi:hypothetical protein
MMSTVIADGFQTYEDIIRTYLNQRPPKEIEFACGFFNE